MSIVIIILCLLIIAVDLLDHGWIHFDKCPRLPMIVNQYYDHVPLLLALLVLIDFVV